MINPDRSPALVFGQVPHKEAGLRRRQVEKQHPELKPVSVYDNLRVLPVIKQAIVKAENEESKYWKELKKKKVDFSESVWGNAEIKNYVSPSTVCNCIRWVGEEAVADLTNRPEAEKTVSNIVILKQGSAFHWALEKILKNYLPASQEMTLVDEDVNISGRIDVFMKNPKTGKYQLIELKSMADFAFQKLGRTDLPDYLKTTSEIFAPNPEHRRQVLLYMWILDKQLGVQGKELDSASIIYINRDNGEMKESLIPWDSVAKYDAEDFVRQIIEAQKQIDAALNYIRNTPSFDWQRVEELLPAPTVESKYICEKICPYRLVCRPGRNLAAEGVKKEGKKRPRQVYHMLKQDRLKREQESRSSGVWQEKLGFF